VADVGLDVLFYAEVNRDIAYEMFSVFVRIVKSMEGYREPFCFFGDNKKGEVLSFTSLKMLKSVLALLSGFTEQEVTAYFKKKLQGKKNGSKVAVIVTDKKDFAFVYKLTKGQLTI
jgi:hypothetical protein